VDRQTIKEKLATELEKYNNSEKFKDYFLSMKEISKWLREQEK